MLKRHQNNELGESATRRVAYDCKVDYAKSSRSNCRVCHRYIDQGQLRLALMLQDDEGYKNTAWTHYQCFWKHPETHKLEGTHEIHNLSKLKKEDQQKITEQFEKFQSTGCESSRRRNRRKYNDGNSDYDDETYVPDVERSSRSRSTKRKRKTNTE